RDGPALGLGCRRETCLASESESKTRLVATSADLRIATVCLKSPYSTVCVEITEPDYGTTIGLEHNEAATRSGTVHFVAHASRGTTRLPRSSIAWSNSGRDVAEDRPFHQHL